MATLNQDFYLNLFTPAVREKPRFMALASAVLSQADDLFALLQSAFPEAYSLDTAVGAGLNLLGAQLGIPRPAPDTPDEDYRFLLRARIAARHWDGTNGTLPAALEEAFPGMSARMIDNMDGTVTISVNGELPFPPEDLFPVPAGVRIVEDASP